MIPAREVERLLHLSRIIPSPCTQQRRGHLLWPALTSSHCDDTPLTRKSLFSSPGSLSHSFSFTLSISSSLPEEHSPPFHHVLRRGHWQACRLISSTPSCLSLSHLASLFILLPLSSCMYLAISTKQTSRPLLIYNHQPYALPFQGFPIHINLIIVMVPSIYGESG